MTDILTKICSKCKEEKGIAEFSLGYCDDREEVLLKAAEYLRGDLC